MISQNPLSKSGLELHEHFSIKAALAISGARVGPRQIRNPRVRRLVQERRKATKPIFDFEKDPPDEQHCSPMCDLYSINTNKAAILAFLRVVNRYVGNLPPMPGVFPDDPTKTAGLASIRSHFWNRGKKKQGALHIYNPRRHLSG